MHSYHHHLQGSSRATPG